MNSNRTSFNIMNELNTIETQFNIKQSKKLLHYLRTKFMDIYNEIINKKFITENSYYYDTICQTYSLLFHFKKIINEKNYFEFSCYERILNFVYKLKNREKKIYKFVLACKDIITDLIPYSGYNLYLYNCPEEDINIIDFIQSLNNINHVFHCIQISKYTFLGYLEERNIEKYIHNINSLIYELNDEKKECFMNNDFKRQNKYDKTILNNIFTIKYIKSKINVFMKYYDWYNKINKIHYSNYNLLL